MFDIDRYILRFDNYCDRFVNENISGNTLENIHLKITHSKNVLSHCENIAKTENLNAEDFFIAQLCGLFHDIGRFRITSYNVCYTKLLRLWSLVSNKEIIQTRDQRPETVPTARPWPFARIDSSDGDAMRTIRCQAS